jgi:hypothetical protein
MTTKHTIEPNCKLYFARASKYADHDDSLAAAADDFAKRYDLEDWQVEAIWADDERDEIALRVTC